LLPEPKLAVLRTEHRDSLRFGRVKVEVSAGLQLEGWLLEPSGAGPFPAVLTVFYEPETGVGLKGKNRDFGLRLAKRGMATLSIGSPPVDAWKPDTRGAECQPLSFLAYVAANAHTALSRRPNVDPKRIGVIGHSYGGKWALFAAALHEPFAAVCVSDPGIVFDESRSNVNYWEPWYLGRDPNVTRQPGIPTVHNPRTGAYKRLSEAKRDLHEIHALLAPRPFLVSGGSEDPPERWRALHRLVEVNRVLGFSERVGMTNRPMHDPTPESNAVIDEFFATALAVETLKK
jgi:dienelactone hydrolase